MRKLIVILAALFAPVLAAKAQDLPRHEFQIGSFWGISTVQYRADGAAWRPGTGGGGGLLYTWRFHPRFALVTGAEAVFRRASLQYPDGYGVLSGSRDAAGHLYVSYLPGLQEQQKYTQLLVPVLFQFAPPPGRNGHQFYLSAGGKLGFRLAGSYTQNAGTFHHTQKDVAGEYDFILPWPEEAAGLDDPYIFYQQVGSLAPDGDRPGGTGYTAGGRWGKLPDCIASVELGIRWRLSRRDALYTGLFLDAGLLSQAAAGGALVSTDGTSASVLSALAAPTPSVTVSDSNGSKRIEAAVPSAGPALSSRPRTLGFGLKVRFAFGRGSLQKQ